MLIRELSAEDVEDATGLRRVAFGQAEPTTLRPGTRGLGVELDGRLAAVLTINEFHQFYGGATVPMGDAAAAYEQFAAGGKLGKIVLVA